MVVVVVVVVSSVDTSFEDGTGCSETSANKSPQKKEYNIHNTAEVLNQ